MTPSVATLTGIGAAGTNCDVFDAIDAKFRESFERKFKQLGTQLTGTVTTYGSGSIAYDDADVVINIDGAPYNIGAQADIFSLVTSLNNLDIGFWALDPDDNVTIRGFHSFGDFTQDGAAVMSPEDVVDNNTVPTIADYFRELALLTGSNAVQVGDLSWALDGNDFLTEHWFGTFSAHDIPFRVGNVEHARLYTTGAFKIGLDTITPLGTLHVQGNTGQSPFYASNFAVTKSFEFRDDGNIFRDGALYSITSGTDTTYGVQAGLAIVTQDHNVIFGYHAARFLAPDGGGLGENNSVFGAGTADNLVTGSNITLLGFQTDVSSDPLNDAVAIGAFTMITASNQVVFGQGTHYFSDMWMGAGATSGTQRHFTLHGTNASGSNVAAGNFTFAIGQGRGNSVSGKFIFQNTKPGASGGSQQALFTALTLDMGNVVVGAAALATTATDGFLYIPTCAGTPTGVPTAYTGGVAMIFDTTANKLWIYDGGWLGGTTPGAFV